MLTISEAKEEDTRLGPKAYYKPQRVTKDKSIIAVRHTPRWEAYWHIGLFQFMTSSKAMGALGLMSVRQLEHPVTGTQVLQEKV